MPDVSLYVAVITGGAAVLGAAVSPVSTAYQNSRQAVRDRAERRETAVRQACTGLLGSARDLRVQVANTAAYHGLPREVLDGLRELFKDAFARDASLLSAGMTLVSQALIIVFLAAAHSGRVPTVIIGSVLAASGIGGLLGALVGKWVRRSAACSPLKFQPLIWTVMLAVLVMSGRWQLPAMALVMLVLGLAGAAGNVELDTYLVRKVPDKKLARVTSIEMLFDFAASALGPALGGLLTELYGTRHAMWVLLVLTLPFAVLGFRLRVPGSAVGQVRRALFKLVANLLVEAAIMSLLLGVALRTRLARSREPAGRGCDQDLSVAGAGGDQDRGRSDWSGTEVVPWPQRPMQECVGQLQAQ